MDGNAVRERIRSVEGVDDVADVHAWQVCSHITVATAHVETSAETVAAAETVDGRVHDVLAEAGVDHATVELRSAFDDPHTHVSAHGH